MALMEGLGAGLGGKLALLFGAFAFGKARLPPASDPPALPWAKNQVRPEPTPEWGFPIHAVHVGDLEPAPGFAGSIGKNGVQSGPEPTLERGRRKRSRTPEPAPEITLEDVLELADGCEEPLNARLTVQMHAIKLLEWINHPDRGGWVDHAPIVRGKRLRGLFSRDLQAAYLRMCGEELWWRPHRWEGTHGVAEYFRRLTKQRATYKYTTFQGQEKRWVFYPIPKPAAGVASVKKTPKARKKRLRSPDNLKRAA